MSNVERDNEATPPVGRPLNPLPPADDTEKTGEAIGEARVESTTGTASGKSADREYVVLKGSDEDVNWQLVGSIEASSSEQAIRRAIEKPGSSFLNTEGPTTLVAVPARSWNPSSVAVKTETSIVFS